MRLEEEENAGLVVSCLENQMDGLPLRLVQERVPRYPDDLYKTPWPTQDLTASLVVKLPLLWVSMSLLREHTPFPIIKASGLPRIKVCVFKQLVMGESLLVSGAG